MSDAPAPNVEPSAHQARQRGCLACPVCHGRLVWSSSASRCETCPRSFDSVDGIPLLVRSDLGEEAADAPPDAGGAALLVAEQKRRQASFFDHEDAELEVSRPHGQPAFYGWLLSEKFRRGVSGVGSLLGLSALAVCGGSGMDAEFLVRRGASVTSIDISLGAALRARERAHRQGISVFPVVGDAERLPVFDRSIDLVYVHDGLHHLPDPYVGVAEMARVARRAVSINEPAQAAATSVAVRVGLALEHEDAGNRVGRMDPSETTARLAENGFRVICADRYAMYYHQAPGRAVQFISRRRVVPLAIGGLQLANRTIGRLGNKLTVQAIRHDYPTTGAPTRSVPF